MIVNNYMEQLLEKSSRSQIIPRTDDEILSVQLSFKRIRDSYRIRKGKVAKKTEFLGESDSASLSRRSFQTIGV